MGKTMLIKCHDGETIEFEVLSSTEKESSFQKSVPVMNPSLAGLFFFLNLVPGHISRHTNVALWKVLQLQFKRERLFCWATYSFSTTSLSCYSNWVVLESLAWSLHSTEKQ